MTRRKTIGIVLGGAVMLTAAVIAGVYLAARYFVSQEQQVRTAWRVDVGELLGRDEELALEICQAALEADLTVIQLVPWEVDQEGFTYYDVAVQDRLAQALEQAKAKLEGGWTADAPLAVLNPYGTGSNGLYLYFETDLPTQVTYTIHVEKDDIPDYTAVAANGDGQEYSKTHEFQIIGLVPGETNQVTMTLTGSWGNVRQQVTFSITMPDTHSGYPTRLEYKNGDSGQELSDGLFALMRTNGYLGYGFFFDNSGVMRYEMVLEGYGLDRILFYGDEIVTCISSTRLARLNGLGRVTQVYDLEGYELHHDINYGPQGTVVALVETQGGETVEDQVAEIDLNSGQVTLLADFTQIMTDYFQKETYPVSLTSDFFWQAGEWDWLHLNAVEYREDEDSLIVSSRETSTIIKVEQVHSQPQLTWLLGDPAFWEGTAYENLSLTPQGDFTFQYGQHSVEYAGAGEKEGVYYLSLFNNNYWALNTRDYEPQLDQEVSRSLYGGGEYASWVYLYRVDENEGTFTLEQSFQVPYSSIVSNAARSGEHWVVNSGVAQVFGEYDSQGNLIRQFTYECTMQGYRTFKLEMRGFWFQ